MCQTWVFWMKVDNTHPYSRNDCKYLCHVTWLHIVKVLKDHSSYIVT